MQGVLHRKHRPIPRLALHSAPERKRQWGTFNAFHEKWKGDMSLGVVVVSARPRFGRSVEKGHHVHDILDPQSLDSTWPSPTKRGGKTKDSSRLNSEFPVAADGEFVCRVHLHQKHRPVPPLAFDSAAPSIRRAKRGGAK